MNLKSILGILLGLCMWACQAKPTEADTAKESPNAVAQTEANTEPEVEDINTQTIDDKLITGVWYSPEAKVALLVRASKGKITEIRYAKGAANFTKVSLGSQKGTELGFTIGFSVNNEKLSLEHGFTPMGAYYMISPEGKSTQQIAYQLSDEVADYDNATSVFQWYFVGQQFINYDNNDRIIQTPQEGTNTNEVFLTIKKANGAEEYITAKINPATHELRFTSQSLGNVKALCTANGLDVYNQSNQQIATFSIEPK